MTPAPARIVQIELGRGIGDIVFGMSGAELVQRPGAPDKVAIGGNGSRDLIYHQRQLVLKIEPDPVSAGSRFITTTRPGLASTPGTSRRANCSI